MEKCGKWTTIFLKTYPLPPKTKTLLCASSATAARGLLTNDDVSVTPETIKGNATAEKDSRKKALRDESSVV